MTGLLHSLRSSGTPWRRSPHWRYRLTDRPDCSACTAESQSLSPRPANREDRRSWDLRFSTGTTVGNKPRWSQPSTRIARQLNGRAPGRVPSVDQPQSPPLLECMQLAISQSFSFLREFRASIARLSSDHIDRAFLALGPPVFRPEPRVALLAR